MRVIKIINILYLSIIYIFIKYIYEFIERKNHHFFIVLKTEIINKHHFVRPESKMLPKYII